MRSQGYLFRGPPLHRKPALFIIKEAGHIQAMNCFTFCWHFHPHLPHLGHLSARPPAMS